MLSQINIGFDKLEEDEDKNKWEKEAYQLQFLVDQTISINEEDKDQTTKTIESQGQGSITTKLFLSHVLPSRIDPQIEERRRMTS